LAQAARASRELLSASRSVGLAHEPHQNAIRGRDVGPATSCAPCCGSCWTPRQIAFKSDACGVVFAILECEETEGGDAVETGVQVLGERVPRTESRRR
jgi:hypothetical protein